MTPPLSRSASGWRPLLSGGEAEKALATAEEIAAAIGRPPALPMEPSGFWRRDHRDLSLADGRAGMALGARTWLPDRAAEAGRRASAAPGSRS